MWVVICQGLVFLHTSPFIQRRDEEVDAIQLLTEDDLEFFEGEPGFIEEIREAEKALNAIYHHLLRGDCFFVSKRKEYRREALVHDSPAKGEFKRITTFDEFGPTGHSTRNNLKDIAQELHTSGFQPISQEELTILY